VFVFDVINFMLMNALHSFWSGEMLRDVQFGLRDFSLPHQD